ncbi:MAG TPA: EcsC family protein [Jatrophihabitans sp.]|jgi:hypothetical protein|uniref:EcsC family protein n=1 Tax=Jatrophihabitans sp. TaxID=1932789 RepID=UPI002EFDBE40
MADTVGTSLEKASGQLQKLVTHVVQEGLGPITGSAAYALDRLARTRPGQADLGVSTAPPGSTGTVVGGDSGDGGDPEAAIRRIIRESVAASGTQGFITGLGGLMTLAVSLPANMAGSLIINARMVGAIAYLRGYKLDDPHTQAMIMLTAAGSSAQAVLSELGVVIGKQAAKQAIAAVPMAVIHKINAKAGFYLLAKYGTKRSAVTLAKMIPGVGGVMGGGVDATATRAIGQAAKKVFPA